MSELGAELCWNLKIIFGPNHFMEMRNLVPERYPSFKLYFRSNFTFPSDLWNRTKFSSKIEIFVKNRNFRQKSKLSSKIEIFIKNTNFHLKSNFLLIIEIFDKNRNFRQKSKFSTKIEILVKSKF